MLKRVILTVVVIASVQPPVAEAAYIGTISRQTGYTLEIVAAAGIKTSITFLSVVKGRLEVDHTITVTGNHHPVLVTVSRVAERGILLIDTQNGSSLVKINGGVPQEVTANPEARAVFDIIE